MKINARLILIQMKDHEGDIRSRLFAAEEVGSKQTETFENAEIIDMTYGTEKSTTGLCVRYWRDEQGTKKLVQEVFPLEHASIQITGRKW